VKRLELILLTVMLVSAAEPVVALERGLATPYCNIDAGPCSAKTTDNAIQALLDIAPKPVTAMRELVFSLTLRDKRGPVTNAAVTIDLSMPGMYMGNNVVKLTKRDGGVYEGQGIIVRCPSGKKLWQATINIRRGSASSSAIYLFEVH
jgi:nitrogen fixation protein FixH